MKSAVLLAGLHGGTTRDRIGAHAITLSALAAFGAAVVHNDERGHRRRTELKGQTLDVPGDISSAAF